MADDKSRLRPQVHPKRIYLFLDFVLHNVCLGSAMLRIIGLDADKKDIFLRQHRAEANGVSQVG
jgi:hypothetical protein